jgi:hypothetical protein
MLCYRTRAGICAEKGRRTMLDRRNFMKTCSGMGFAGTLLPGVLWAQAQAEGAKKITKEMIESAAAIADVPIPDEYKDMMLENLNNHAQGFEEIYKLHIPNSVEPALLFDPVLPGMKLDTVRKPARISKAPASAASGAPKNLEELAFASVRELSELVRTKKVSSVALTEMYLGRLKKYDPTLKFVVTLTEERALAQAKKADAEIAAGKYRGPLHGLPWGAKDLLAVKGYRTTWGAGGFENQMIEEDAAVVKRLDEAGAVLVAKLTLGALAQGDIWFGGVTRNPWNTKQGSSGSSAGPASATAAGCVAFTIGSETLGSISSPSTRCGCTGLEHGQTRPHLPRRRRLRAGARRDLWPGRPRSHCEAGRFQLGCNSGLEKTPRRLLESGLRTQTRRRPRAAQRRTGQDS